MSIYAVNAADVEVSFILMSRTSGMNKAKREVKAGVTPTIHQTTDKCNFF
jgi:hypothetical protein